LALHGVLAVTKQMEDGHARIIRPSRPGAQVAALVRFVVRDGAPRLLTMTIVGDGIYNLTSS
jgi:hypothetical protein